MGMIATATRSLNKYKMPGANLFATGYFYAYFQAATARVRIVAERQDAGLLVACAFLTWRQPMLRKFKELPNIAREFFISFYQVPCDQIIKLLYQWGRD